MSDENPTIREVLDIMIAIMRDEHASAEARVTAAAAVLSQHQHREHLAMMKSTARPPRRSS